MDPCAWGEGWCQGWGGAAMRCLRLLLLRDGVTKCLVIVCIMQQLDDDHSSARQVDLCLALHAQHILCDFSALPASLCLHFLVSQMDLIAFLWIWNKGQIIWGPIVGAGWWIQFDFYRRYEIILFHQKMHSYSFFLWKNAIDPQKPIRCWNIATLCSGFAPSFSPGCPFLTWIEGSWGRKKCEDGWMGMFCFPFTQIYEGDVMTVGLDNLICLFQSEWLYDSMILCS